MTSDRRWAIALFALGAAARLGAALWLGNALYFVDEAIYVDAARRLLAGEGFGASYNNVPAYPVVLAALAAPWPDHVVLIRVSQALVTAAGVVPLLWLGQRLFGTWPARVAGVLYALDPLMVVSGALLYAEAVATVVLLLALLGAWSAVPDRLAWSAGVGLLLGGLAQLRPVALVLVPVVGLWIAAYAQRRRLRHALAVGAGCALALAPWTLRNYRVHGGLVPISTAGTQSAPVAREEVREHGLTTSLARRMWRDPGGAASRIASELGHFWALFPNRISTDKAERRAAFHEEDPRLPTEVTFSPRLRDRVSALSFGVEMAFALGGSVLAWRRHRAAAMLLLAVCIAYGLGYALIVGKLRYRIPVLPCVFLMAGVAAARVPWAAPYRSGARGFRGN
jgi:uncharacterized protein YqgC (DUF456 family)